MLLVTPYNKYFFCATLLDLLKFAIRFLSNRHCESSEVRRSPKSVHSLSRFTFFLCVPTPVLWVWTVNGKRGQLQGSCKPLAVQLEASGCRRRNRRHTGMVESRCDRKGQGKRAREGSSCVCVCCARRSDTQSWCTRHGRRGSPRNWATPGLSAGL